MFLGWARFVLCEWNLWLGYCLDSIETQNQVYMRPEIVLTPFPTDYKKSRQFLFLPSQNNMIFGIVSISLKKYDFYWFCGVPMVTSNVSRMVTFRFVWMKVIIKRLPWLHRNSKLSLHASRNCFDTIPNRLQEESIIFFPAKRK